jgi:predicted NBD/HSP70 family sugar kinase
MTQYVGLDVSLKETKVHVLDEAGNRVWRGRCATEPTAIAAAVRRLRSDCGAHWSRDRAVDYLAVDRAQS